MAGLPGVGVTGDARVRLTPAGTVPTHAADNVTAELNPFKEVTLIVATWLPPRVSVTEGVDVIEKSGAPLAVLFVAFVRRPVTVKLAEAESSLGVLVAVTS
jgi:hypothetical protein